MRAAWLAEASFRVLLAGDESRSTLPASPQPAEACCPRRCFQPRPP